MNNGVRESINTSVFLPNSFKQEESFIPKVVKSLIEDMLYSSLDFLTNCGIGLCGSCATSKGCRACVDGNFLKHHQL